jgi:hypothetical protein
MRCGKASAPVGPEHWIRTTGVDCKAICVRRRVISAWPPRCGMVRSYLNICVTDTGWTWGYGNVSDCFDKWAFGYASRAPKLPSPIRCKSRR